MGSTYREFAPPPGLNAVACIWTSHDRAVDVLPDGCVDVVFSAGRLTVAGPATVTHVAPPTPGHDRCGVRFRIGAAGAALGLPAAELLDIEVDLTEVWGREGRRLADNVAAAPEPAAALARGLAERIPVQGDPLVREAVVGLTRRQQSVDDAARSVGLSERHLRRRFTDAVGYGPSTLLRVLRFQRFLHLAASGGTRSLAGLAADAGYADQAHLARECRRLSGVPPSTLLAAGPLPAGEAAGLPAWRPFKPGAAG